MGRYALTLQPPRPLCQCGNLVAINCKSKAGYTLYKSLCNRCTKYPYRQIKKPHCERCGFSAIDKCQLDMHHKDRDNQNNDISNLETLCANCHRLEHRNEFKGR